jgi:hypothetical protein
MTAIYGAVAQDGRRDLVRDLEPVAASLTALGPDGGDVWSGTLGRCPVVVGARLRRRVVEDDHDAQPVGSADAAVIVAADVVLDPTSPATEDDEGEEAQIDINTLGSGPIASSRAHIDQLLGFASSDLTPDEVGALRPACDAAIDAELTATRCRKIHDGLLTGPGGAPIVSPAATRAAIYIVRDPRDVAVSYAHHSGRSPAWAVDQLSDPDAMLEPSLRWIGTQTCQRLGSWSEHVSGWLDHDLFPVTLVRYEDLHAEPVGEFGRVARFAGLDRTDNDVTRASRPPASSVSRPRRPGTASASARAGPHPSSGAAPPAPGATSCRPSWPCRSSTTTPPCSIVSATPRPSR